MTLVRGMIGALTVAGLVLPPAASGQLTVEEEGVYAPGLYVGPCEHSDTRGGRAPAIGDTWTIRNVLTRYHFQGVFGLGGEVGEVSNPECRAVFLPPGEYVRRVLGFETSFKAECAWGDPSDCTQSRIEKLSDEFIDESVEFTVSDRCSPPMVGTITYLRGTVTDESGRSLERGSQIHRGGEIVTGADTKLEIRDREGNAFRVGPNSRFRNNHHVCRPERPDVTPELLLGRIWMYIAGRTPEEYYRVRTANAVNGVRGTIFEVEASERDGEPMTVVRVHEGEVEVWNRSDPEARVLVEAGLETRVVGSSPPTEPAAFTPDGLWDEIERAAEESAGG